MAGVCNLDLWEKVSEKTYRHDYPDSNKEESYFYHDGMFLENSRSYDLTKYYSLVFELAAMEENEYIVTVKTVLFREGKSEEKEFYHAACATSEYGEYKIEIPVDLFDIGTALTYNLRFVRGFSISGSHAFQMKKAYLKAGKTIAVKAAVQGQAGQFKAVYQIELYNCTDQTQQVALSWKKHGNEATERVKFQKKYILLPQEKRDISIEVSVSEDIVPGGYETQLIQFIPNGKGSEKEEIEFYTAKRMNHPFLLMDADEMEAVREKIKTCEWAEENYKELLLQEMEWKAPKIKKNRSFLFWSSDAEHARCCATLFRLGASKEYKDKAIAFLKELSNPVYGYCKNPRACNQELVHEGGFFQNVAIAYDFLYDEPEFSKEDHQNMEAVLRKFMNYIDSIARCGNISNWAVLEIAGALYCACVLQDMKMVNRFLYDAGGFVDQLGKGTLSDGWWYEVSMGYNLLAAGNFSMIAQVMLHFGIDLRYMNVPARYNKKIDARKVLQDGLVIEDWSENTKNYRNISMLWDSLVDFYDYRGVVFGINDSEEKRVEGTARQLIEPRYDIAYYLYQNPEYAELLKHSEKEKRDLLFGAAEFPEMGENKRGKHSVYVDSAGACVLRSQKNDVPDREKIQAVLKYGSHGGAHGHYDRVSMTNLMRYGRSLTGPENIWYSYHTFMYKFYVQTSLNHNMVVVDLKMQDAVPPRRTLFYSGKMLQAAAVENKGVWSYPPYGGWQVNGDRTFKERSFHEGRFVPVPEQEPEYAVRSGFTGIVTTRRLMVVTDDFAVNFDYAVSEEEHDYDCLYHLQGLQDIQDLEGKRLIPDKHTEQLDDCMLGGAQFITDCDWYEMENGCRLQFHTVYTETENNGNQWMCRNRTACNEPGEMNTYLYAAYPTNAELIVGCDPEYQGVNKQLFYAVEADGDQLADGSFGAWILGREDVDVDIRGRKTLCLKTRVRQVEFEEGQYLPMEKSIFWGNPEIMTEEGTWIPLVHLPLDYENVDMTYEKGKDYAGGPVKIQARLYELAVGAEPLDYNKTAVISLNLNGLNAVRFRSGIGGDYPVGDENGRRRTVAVRQHAKEAFWTTVLEPVERECMIESVYAGSPQNLEVKMKDGRRVLLQVTGLGADSDKMHVKIEEYRDQEKIREEETQ